MSVLSAIDIERDIDDVICGDYQRACKEYGDRGRDVWLALFQAIQKCGINHTPQTMSFHDHPFAPRANDGYNLEELQEFVNHHLRATYRPHNVLLEHIQFRFNEHNRVQFSARVYDPEQTTVRDLTMRRLELYYNEETLKEHHWIRGIIR